MKINNSLKRLIVEALLEAINSNTGSSPEKVRSAFRHNICRKTKLNMSQATWLWHNYVEMSDVAEVIHYQYEEKMILAGKCEELNEITDAIDRGDAQDVMVKRAMLQKATELLEDVVGANRLEQMFVNTME